MSVCGLRDDEAVLSSSASGFQESLHPVFLFWLILLPSSGALLFIADTTTIINRRHPSSYHLSGLLGCEQLQPSSSPGWQVLRLYTNLEGST